MKRKSSFWLVLGSAPCILFSSGILAAETTSPQQTIREAIHAESSGLADERTKIIAEASLQNPDAPLLNAYQGNVKQNGAWRSLEEAAKKFAQDDKLQRYAIQRALTKDDLRDNLRLADWCAQEKLPDQERAHLLRAIDLEPGNAAIRQRLGHVWTGSEWLTREQVVEQTAAAQEQAAGNKKYAAIVAAIQRKFNGSAKARRLAAAEMKKIQDPLAIALLEETFAAAADEATLALLETLSSIDDVRAAQSLARISVMSNSPAVREQAAKELGKRDKFTYAPQLLAALRGPVRSRTAMTLQQNGQLLYRHEFVREAQDKNEVVVMDTHFNRVNLGGSEARTEREARQIALQSALQREWEAQRQSMTTEQVNSRIMKTLEIATGEQIAAQPDAWWAWWDRYNESYQAGTKPAQTYYLTSSRQVVDQIQLPSQARFECFVAGTQVWTAQGHAAIEKLRVGDLVLAQDVDSGELIYKPVVRTTIRPKSPLVRLTIGSERLQCTGGHLFWVMEQGWVKASQLKPGMQVHGAKGSSLVTATEPAAAQPTFNLVVDGHHNYFVGDAKLLTHDNTPRNTTKLVSPGVE